VAREVEFADVYAERGVERLYAEAKGRTAAIGLDVDTLYGQLLRRMNNPGTTTRYRILRFTAVSDPCQARVAFFTSGQWREIS